METTYIVTSTSELTPNQAAFVGGFLGTMLTVSLIVIVLLIIASWRIFTKAGEKGWKVLIPIYNFYILFKICGLKGWFWAMFGISILSIVLMCINTPPTIEDATGYHLAYDIDWSQYPTYIAGIIITVVAGLITDIVVSFKLAKAFGKGIGYTLGLIFLPNIFTLILGFGKAKYNKQAI